MTFEHGLKSSPTLHIPHDTKNPRVRKAIPIDINCKVIYLDDSTESSANLFKKYLNMGMLLVHLLQNNICILAKMALPPLPPLQEYAPPHYGKSTLPLVSAFFGIFFAPPTTRGG